MKKHILPLMLLVISTWSYAQQRYTPDILNYQRTEAVESRGCGRFTITIPIKTTVSTDGMLLQYFYPAITTDSEFRFSCDPLEPEMTVNGPLRYNPQTEEWELNPARWENYSEEEAKSRMNSFTVYQLKSKNSKGWLTVLRFPMGTPWKDITQKSFYFCLMRPALDRALCGGGNAVILDGDGKEYDFEAFLTEMVKTIEFLD